MTWRSTAASSFSRSAFHAQLSSGQRGLSEDHVHDADQLYQGFYANIRRYFPTPGSWKQEYEKYPRILYAPTLSGDWPRLAVVRATYQQMPYLVPVYHDWAKIKVKALVLGGDQDTPDFPERAKHIAETIPGGQLVLLPNLGHVPH